MNSCSQCGIELPVKELWTRYPDFGSIAYMLTGEQLRYCSNCKFKEELQNKNAHFTYHGD